jgi:hypothetical protein
LLASEDARRRQGSNFCFDTLNEALNLRGTGARVSRASNTNEKQN